MTYFQAEAGKLQEIIDNVRGLHQPIESFPMFKGQACRHCSDLKNGYIQMYPCPTVGILDGTYNVAATLERDDDYDSRRDDYQEEDLG